MTSRRSRLKAVTNLPVRRKVLAVQGNTSDTSSVDNFTTEKIVSSHPKSDEVLPTAYNSDANHITEKNGYEISNKNKGNDSVKKVNCSDFQKNENFTNENDIIKSKRPDISETLESRSDLTKTCNLLSCRAESNNSSVFKSDHCYKLNSGSLSLEGIAHLQTLESRKENEVLVQENCAINYTSNNNNNNNNNNINNQHQDRNNSYNNNIMEDGFKSYTVLTPHNVRLDSLTEYTITPLVSCEGNYIDTTVSDANAPQEFEEVQIYTEVESTELYINNQIDANNESVIETEHLEPVLTSLSNYNSENNVNCINSDIIELENNSESLVAKTVKKVNHFKTTSNENNKRQKSFTTQVKDSNVSDTLSVSSASQKVSPDLQLYKQISTVRRKRVKYNDYTKKLADAKREFQRKYEKTKPDRSSLKMIDLIFYNPTSNPMESKSKFEKKETLEPSSELLNDLLAEEKLDEPEILDSNSTSNMSDNESESMNKMPVPQVKIGLDGEIILDEKSIIIETTEAKKGREGLQNSVPILEDKGSKVSYYRGKSKKTRDWADFETKRFYKALNTIGPDFTLMQKYFPKRSRLELKNKFKREERLNRALIDKALNNPSEFDMTQLEKDLAVEKEAEEGIQMRFCRIVKQTARKPKIKTSLLSREIIESDGEPLKSLQVNSKRFSDTERNKKEKEFDFVLHKLLMKECEKSGSTLPEIASVTNALRGSGHEVT